MQRNVKYSRKMLLKTGMTDSKICWSCGNYNSQMLLVFIRARSLFVLIHMSLLKVDSQRFLEANTLRTNLACLKLETALLELKSNIYNSPKGQKKEKTKAKELLSFLHTKIFVQYLVSQWVLILKDILLISILFSFEDSGVSNAMYSMYL